MIMNLPDIPTAISPREASFMSALARGKTVVEFGALLGFSTVVLARSARWVTSVDRHQGYLDAGHTTYRAFMNNIGRHKVENVSVVIADALTYTGTPGTQDMAFVDLTGEYTLTLKVLKGLNIRHRVPLVLVHDLLRSNCQGVEQAITDANWKIVGQVDTLALCVRR